jgi:hypothetical protein
VGGAGGSVQQDQGHLKGHLLNSFY